MKILLWVTVSLAVLASVLSGPIPEHHSEGIFVTKVNNSAVCVVNRSVYQVGERLPMEDKCEICRCRPPGFACAYVRCSKKDPKPGCNIVDLVGQCCPQYRCDVAPKHPEPEAPSSSSSKPDILKDDAALGTLLVKEDDPINGKVIHSTESNVDGHAAIIESSTANVDLDQRAAEESSSSKPAGDSDGKSLEESSSAAPAPEVSREERIETNEILADDANNGNANASEPEEGGRSEQQQSTQNPDNEENIDARSAAPLWNEEQQSSPAPGQEKIERKEDLIEGASSSAPLLLAIDLRHAEEQHSSESTLIDEKIELSAASSEPSLLNEKSVEDNKNLTLMDEPKIETLPLLDEPKIETLPLLDEPKIETLPLKEEEKLDITVLKGDKLPEKREKRETIEILLEKEVNPSTSEPELQPQPQPQPNESEIKEKSSEKLLPEIDLKEKELLDEPQEIQPSSQAPPNDDILIAETLSKGPEEKILPLAAEPQGSSSAKPSLSQN